MIQSDTNYDGDDLLSMVLESNSGPYFFMLGGYFVTELSVGGITVTLCKTICTILVFVLLWRKKWYLIGYE